MQKRKHIKPILFKTLLIAVFGAFFFVQAQSSFIYCAYDSDFPSAVSSHTIQHAKPGFYKDSPAKNSSGYSKLNKRYQAVTPHAILPAPIIIPVYFILLQTNWCTSAVIAQASFLHTKNLRGPPSI